MSESPQEWYERASAGLAADGPRSSFTDWDVFPWQEDWSVKELQAPTEERPRRGADGVECFSCDRARTLDGVAWADELFHVSWVTDSSLPFAAFLMPNRHADLAQLTPAEAARQGELLTLIERAAIETTSVPRIQVARWGDGSEHLHWWLYGRPAGMAQLRGSFLMIWDDLLPTRPEGIVRADGHRFAQRLQQLAGGRLGPGQG